MRGRGGERGWRRGGGRERGREKMGREGGGGREMEGGRVTVTERQKEAVRVTVREAWNVPLSIHHPAERK